MTTIMRIITISMLTIIAIFSVASCSPSVSSGDYDSVTSELKNVESQLTALQEKLAEAALIEPQYQSLNISFEELQKQYDARNDEIQKLKTEYDELNAKYKQLKGQNDTRNEEFKELQSQFEELQSQYDIIIRGNIVFNEEEIEQAIFTLINQERKNNGVDELEWGINLYKLCRQNSREMAEIGELKSYEGGSYIWQELFRATKYGTIDQIANATLVIWRSNDYRYRYGIINKKDIYGAVGTYNSGDIYYITYMTSIYR
ncbi:CAP domain-containing protein [Chloroflexota bacterium]